MLDLVPDSAINSGPPGRSDPKARCRLTPCARERTWAKPPTRRFIVLVHPPHGAALRRARMPAAFHAQRSAPKRSASSSRFIEPFGAVFAACLVAGIPTYLIESPPAQG